MNETVQQQAEREYSEEKHRDAVDQLKDKLREEDNRPLLHKIFPWKITVTRR